MISPMESGEGDDSSAHESGEQKVRYQGRASTTFRDHPHPQPVHAVRDPQLARQLLPSNCTLARLGGNLRCRIRARLTSLLPARWSCLPPALLPHSGVRHSNTSTPESLGGMVVGTFYDVLLYSITCNVVAVRKVQVVATPAVRCRRVRKNVPP